MYTSREEPIALRPQGSQWQSIADAMRSSILEGEYAPGQRLIEEEVALRYSSTRFNVRRALDELTAQRLLEQLPNRGARLHRVPVATAIELYAARGALDALVATNAARRARAQDQAELSALREKTLIAATEGDVAQFEHLRTMCAHLLGTVSNQTEAGVMVEQATARLWWHRRRLVFGPRPPRIAVHDVVAVIDAVMARDDSAAQVAVISHNEAVRAALGRLQPESRSGGFDHGERIERGEPSRSRLPLGFQAEQTQLRGHA